MDCEDDSWMMDYMDDNENTDEHEKTWEEADVV